MKLSHMKHLGKNKGVHTRACSKCGGDLGDRYGKQRYCKACHAQYMRATRPNYWLLPDEARQKSTVRSLANYAMKKGRLKPAACSRCGNPKSEKHHPDYSKPLEVVWLCRLCHLEVHKQQKTAVAA